MITSSNGQLLLYPYAQTQALTVLNACTLGKMSLGNLQRGFLLDTAKALELYNINKAQGHIYLPTWNIPFRFYKQWCLLLKSTLFPTQEKKIKCYWHKRHPNKCFQSIHALWGWLERIVLWESSGSQHLFVFRIKNLTTSENYWGEGVKGGEQRRKSPGRIYPQQQSQ